MHRRLFCVALTGIAFCLSMGLTIAVAVEADDTRSPAEVLPPTIVAMAEAPRVERLLASVLDHPLRKRVEAMPQVRQARLAPGFSKFQLGLVFVEAKLGMKWRAAVEAMTDGGLAIALDGKTQGVVAVARARDEATLTKIRETLMQIARDDAERKGKTDPYEPIEYREAAAYKVDKAIFATVGPWLVVTNQKELGRNVVDRLLDGGDSLADQEQFIAARKSISGEPIAWAYLDLAKVRAAGVAGEFFKAKTDNPGAELLVGGVLSNLTQAPFATAALYLDEQQMRFVAGAPHRAEWIPSQRDYFFASKDAAPGAPTLRPKQTLLTLRTHRDISGMWLASPDLFDEAMNAELAQADSNLSTLFSGLDFGRDVLGAIGPEIQLIAARQEFKDTKLPVPSIKLPSGALAMKLKDADQMARRLKISYQSLIGFLNVVGAMNGQPQLEMDTVKVGDATLVTATYLEDVRDAEGPGKIHYNFSPSVVLVDDWFILSSTKELAHELVGLTTKPATAVDESGTRENTALGISMPVLRKVAADNREHLIAQNMLEKGHDRAAAEKEIDALVEVLGWFQDVSLRLVTDKQSLRLELGVSVVGQ